MREKKLKQKASEMIEDGQKPSATLLAEELDYSSPDVHRCLNILEKKGEVETYTKEVLGQKHRMVGVKRT